MSAMSGTVNETPKVVQRELTSSDANNVTSHQKTKKEIKNAAAFKKVCSILEKDMQFKAVN